MAATDALNSLDTLLAQAKQEFESERSALQAQLTRAEANADAYKTMLESEMTKAAQAVRTTATLLAHFGSVSKIFADVQKVAIAAGADIQLIDTKIEGAATIAKTGIERAIDNIEGILHSGAAQNSSLVAGTPSAQQ